MGRLGHRRRAPHLPQDGGSSSGSSQATLPGAARPCASAPPGPPSLGDPAPPSSLSVSPLGSLQAFVPTSPGQRDRPWPPAPRAPHAAPALPVPLSRTHLTRHFADPSAVRATRADVPPRPLLRPQRLTVLNQALLNECMRG